MFCVIYIYEINIEYNCLSNVYLHTYLLLYVEYSIHNFHVNINLFLSYSLEFIPFVFLHFFLFAIIFSFALLFSLSLKIIFPLHFIFIVFVIPCCILLFQSVLVNNHVCLETVKYFNPTQPTP